MSINHQTTVFASWNGSIETVEWQVFEGPKPEHLHFVAAETKSGFETAISVNSQGPFFQVKALDTNGKGIGESTLNELGFSN